MTLLKTSRLFLDEKDSSGFPPKMSGHHPSRDSTQESYPNDYGTLGHPPRGREMKPTIFAKAPY